MTAPGNSYQAFLDKGRFLIQRDRTTGTVFHFPRVMAPGNGSQDLEWFEPSGLGTVYAATIVSQRPPTPNYNVVLVDLDEGPRIMSRVEDAAEADVRIGLRVQARVDDVDGTGTLVFVPVSGGLRP